MRIAIIASKFNGEITEALIAGAFEAFAKHKIPKKNIALYRVPGAFEITVKAAQLLHGNLNKKPFDGVLALGCVLKGETDHYDYICQGLVYGLQNVAITYRTPVIFGVLTCRTYAQAKNRSKKGKSNKGYVTATALIDML